MERRNYQKPTDTSLSYIFEFIGPNSLRDILFYESDDLICVGALDLTVAPMKEIEADLIHQQLPSWTCVTNLNANESLNDQKSIVTEYLPRGGYVVIENQTSRGLVVLDKLEQLIYEVLELIFLSFIGPNF